MEMCCRVDDKKFELVKPFREKLPNGFKLFWIAPKKDH